MPLNILIVGAGVGGPTSAFLLLRSNPDHQITVIERHSALRANGQQIDLRAQGIPIMRKLGLLGAVKAAAVPERGFELLDKNGRRGALVTANGSGQGRQSFTSDYEVMRGDLVALLHRASLEESAKAGGKGWIRYEFGKTVAALAQDDETGVDVAFSDGSAGRYDLVVGADGQSSKTRQLLFGKEASDASFKPLGVYAAFYSIPRSPSPAGEDEDALAKVLHAPGGRLLMTRPSRPDLTGVYLMMTETETETATGAEGEVEGEGEGNGGKGEIQASLREPIERQKEVWARLFAGAGWETDRLLRALRTSEDFYASALAQVRLPHFVRGRVALVGDSGYAPSPATGMGTTLSVAGAYVLAGELVRHRDDDVPAALRAYEEVLRPLVAEAQRLPPGFPSLALPQSELGISLLRWVAGVITTLKVDKLLGRVLPESKGGWTPPEYPELKLDS